MKKTRRILLTLFGFTAVSVICLILTVAGKASKYSPATESRAMNRTTAQSETIKSTEAVTVETILVHADDYPQELIEALQNNPELLDFVANYPGTTEAEIDLTGDYNPGEIPLLMQWDLRWGYAPYGGGSVNDSIGLSGCGPTSLSMVIVGLTGNTQANPRAVAEYATQHGYCTSSNGTDWRLLYEGCEDFGVTAYEVPLWEASMAQVLETGHPLICSMKKGEFTSGSGHFIVLTAYKDGFFSLNDCNSVENSRKLWTYDEIEAQIKNIWAYEVL